MANQTAAEELPDTPISIREPNLNRRLTALMVAANDLGLVSFIGPRVAAGETLYPVAYADQVYMLQADEVLPFLYGLALGVGGRDLADKLAYRPEMTPDLAER